MPLLDDHVAILRQHRSLVAAIRLSAQHWDESSDAVFPSTVGTWQRPSNVQRRFRRLRDRLEWEGNIRPHSLRHTYASLLFAANVNIVTIQDLLGHADLSTTRSIYVHLTDDVRRDASDALEQHMRKGV